MKLAGRIVLFVAVLAVFVIAGIVLVYWTIPLKNTDQAKFDTIVVLGFPANADGSPSAIERERVLAAVDEYRAGAAPTLIMTGGKAHNAFVEAHVMAKYAEMLGVPRAAVIEEDQAHDTIQNAYYSTVIMREHDWSSAEVVSSNSHLRRASLIFAHFPIRYRMHGTNHDVGSGTLFAMAAYADEAYKTDRIRIFGFRPNRFLP
jgi:uncharacterized SAM-binding protein YcdF (DUF218 family)